ncbi:MAG: hypothetical protein HY426_03280 [Candidatus Levybacteria bacterium]|nr:hypothetical protein [Candidatus Levybacteria bacterium]
MKIYFNASLAGKKDYLEHYKIIINVVKKIGHEVISDQVMKRDVANVNLQTKEEHAKDFQKAKKEIKNSDVMIIEGTAPSIGVGLLMGIALDMYKPVLILYLTTPHGLLIGDPDRLLTVKYYASGDRAGLRKIIKVFLESANKRALKYKFNLMINKSQKDYLGKVSKNIGVSRAKVIRNLIDIEFKRDFEDHEKI